MRPPVERTRRVHSAALAPTALAPAALALTALLFAWGCPKRPQFEMEAPGRPAVSWEHEEGSAPEKPDAQVRKETERALLAEVRTAEQKGKDELALASSLYNLAILRRQQGEYAEAERLYQRALEIRERQLGPNHPEVATTLNNLAGLQAARGDYDAAQPLLERALTIRQTALGEAHALTAQSMSNLALLYAAQGNAAAAEPLYQQALSILEKTDTSGEVDRVLDNYAALLHDTGRDAEAEQLEARARNLRAARAEQPKAPD